MKLEPVYLVAPPRRITTRRAFLFAVGAACGGCVVGFGGGWVARGWAAASQGQDPPKSPQGPTLDPSLAKRIEWAKGIASRSSDSEIKDNMAAFLAVLRQAHAASADSPELWTTAKHAADLLTADPSIPSRRLLARSLLAVSRLRPGLLTQDAVASIQTLAGQ